MTKSERELKNDQGAAQSTPELLPTQADRPEFCPTPPLVGCCQQPIVMGNAGFIVWRCAKCGSESWT